LRSGQGVDVDYECEEQINLSPPTLQTPTETTIPGGKTEDTPEAFFELVTPSSRIPQPQQSTGEQENEWWFDDYGEWWSFVVVTIILPILLILLVFELDQPTQFHSDTNFHPEHISLDKTLGLETEKEAPRKKIESGQVPAVNSLQRGQIPPENNLQPKRGPSIPPGKNFHPGQIVELVTSNGTHESEFIDYQYDNSGTQTEFDVALVKNPEGGEPQPIPVLLSQLRIPSGANSGTKPSPIDPEQNHQAGQIPPGKNFFPGQVLDLSRSISSKSVKVKFVEYTYNRSGVLEGALVKLPNRTEPVKVFLRHLTIPTKPLQ